jgi:hypothetical protein
VRGVSIDQLRRESKPMRRRPIGWRLSYRAHAILFPFDVVLLAFAFGLGFVSYGGAMHHGISNHALIGGVAALAALTRAVGACSLVLDGRDTLLRAVVCGSRPGWEIAQANRDLGRVTSLAVPVAVLLLLAAATGLTPGWALVHRWTASFTLGFTAIGSPLIGLVLWARVRRIAASETALTTESEPAATPSDIAPEK